MSDICTLSSSGKHRYDPRASERCLDCGKKMETTGNSSQGNKLVRWIFKQKEPQIITVFPKGTIVKFTGIPCKLLIDTPYYSETFKST